MKQKTIIKVSVLGLVIIAMGLMAATPVYAADQACVKFQGSKSALKECEKTTPKECLGIDRSTQDGENRFDSCLIKSSVSSKNNPFVKDIQTIVNILSAGVGIIVVIMIMIGGVQYSIAGDNPTALTAAKKKITDALIALFFFAFSFAFIQWLIPGGIFG